MYTVRTIVSTHKGDQLISLITTDAAYESIKAAVAFVDTKIDANDLVTIEDGHMICYEIVLIAGAYATSFTKVMEPAALDDLTISYEVDVSSLRSKHLLVYSDNIEVAREHFHRFVAVSLGMHSTKDIETLDAYATIIQRWFAKRFTIAI